MRKVISRPRLLLFLALFSLSFYIHFSHLSEAMPSFPDENRAYHFTFFSPLVFLICRFFANFFKSFDLPFYVMAGFNFVNAFLLYFYFKKFFSGKIAVLAAAFYILFDFPLAFSKQLYYSTIVTTFALSSFVFLELYSRKKNFLWAYLSGSFIGLTFLLNPSSYGVLLAFLCFSWIHCRYSVRESGLSFRIFLLRFSIGFMVPLVALNFLTKGLGDGQDFFSFLVYYQRESKKFGPGLPYILNHLKGFFYSCLSSPSQFFRNFLILASIFYSCRVALKNKDKRLLSFFALPAAGFLLPVIAGSLGLHTVDFRHFVWLSIFLTATFAYAADSLISSENRKKALFSGLLFGAYFFLATIQCVHLADSMKSYNDIFDYFKAKGIEKRSVISELPLNRYADYKNRNFASGVPMGWFNGPKKTIYVVNWRLVYYAYRSGQIRYFLSSGYGDIEDFGMHDKILNGVAPLASWPHPHNNKYIFMEPSKFSIKLYDLKQVFNSPEARSEKWYAG